MTEPQRLARMAATKREERNAKRRTEHRQRIAAASGKGRVHLAWSYLASQVARQSEDVLNEVAAEMVRLAERYGRW